jgi:hypothetical protein
MSSILFMGMHFHDCSIALLIDFVVTISVLIIGGDGSVINVINALIRYTAKRNRTK